MQDITGKVFTLSSQIEVRDLPDGTRLYKQLAYTEYLALNPTQQGVLKLFDGNRTVEAILHVMLQSEERPDIRGFYDLVLTAIQRGFLIEKGAGDAAKLPVSKTEPNKHASGGILMAIVCLGLGGWVMATGAWQPITELTGWFQVLSFIALGLSFSSIWAASALNSFGRVAYHPRFRFDRLVPFFSVDARDAFMGGRICEVSVAAQALAAPFLLAIFGWLTGSGNVLLASALTALVLGSPFGTTPAHTLLHALLRKEYELPHCADRFLSTKLFTTIFNWKTKLQEERYFLGYSTYAILWLGVAFRFANSLMADYGRFLFQQLSHQRSDDATMLSLVIYWLLAIVLLAIVAYLFWVVLRSVYRALAPKLFHAESRLPQTVGANRPSDDELNSFLGETLLCGQLPAELRNELARAMSYVLVGRDTVIIRERDSGDAMFLVYSGSVDVFKEDEAGNELFITRLGKGDAFGEIALLDKVPRTSSVKAHENPALLKLSRNDFERILVNNLGSAQIKTLIQISAFLRRNPLFAKWHPQALLQISREFVLQDSKAGEAVIKEGAANEAFYLVYEGEFNVVRQGRTTATLGPGDFCGEISLLKNIPATADVVAGANARCLRLDKERFLRLVSHDFLTGLTIEATADARGSQTGGAA